MAVLHIVDAAFNNFTQQFWMTVDVLRNPDDEDYTVLVPVPRDKMYTSEILQEYIESYIKNQKRASPDYTGLTWRCDQV